MNKAYYVNHIQEKHANVRFRLSVVDGKTRVGLFAKELIKPGEELLAYYGAECKNLFDAVLQDDQTSRATQTPEEEVIDVTSRLTGVISIKNHAKRTSATSPAITISKTSGLSTDSQLSATEEYDIQGQLTVVEIDSPPFKILSCAKSPYFYITPKKVWKDSQIMTELHGEYGTSVLNLM